VDILEIEGRIVERCVEHAQRRGLIPVAGLITRAENGWVYPIAAAFLLVVSARCVAAAAASLAVAFTIYPPLKRTVARIRPCHASAYFIDAPPPLDRYSFPSGHAMTAAAFGVPVILAAPAAAIPLVLLGFALVSWSRIALGHHYLSDVLGGSLIGAGIAAVVAPLFL
jgi:undecaprenyl-diphosphatase